MQRERIILILGIITALMPLSGFPTTWKRFLLVVFGVVIAYMASYLIKEKKARLKTTRGNNKGNTYVENRNFLREKESQATQDADSSTTEDSRTKI